MKIQMTGRFYAIFSIIIITLCPVMFPGCKATSTNEAQKAVEIGSAKELGEYFDSIGYNVSTNPDILKAIPRTRFTHVPDNWKKETFIPLKKSVFFRAMASGILQVNEAILSERKRLLNLKLDNMSKDDRQWLAQIMTKYKVTDKEDSFTSNQLEELINRVDIIPASLALVQSAIESGWGGSRFAREGNALFGQWTTGRGIKAKKSNAQLAAFSTPRKSIVAYCMNLNTHRSYSKFRKVRAEMRKKGKPLDGYELASYLESYSEKGEEYTKLVRSMIRKHGLEIADTAQLAKGPEVVIRPVSK